MPFIIDFCSPYKVSCLFIFNHRQILRRNSKLLSILIHLKHHRLKRPFMHWITHIRFWLKLCRTSRWFCLTNNIYFDWFRMWNLNIYFCFFLSSSFIVLKIIHMLWFLLWVFIWLYHWRKSLRSFNWWFWRENVRKVIYNTWIFLLFHQFFNAFVQKFLNS